MFFFPFGLGEILKIERPTLTKLMIWDQNFLNSQLFIGDKIVQNWVNHK